MQWKIRKLKYDILIPPLGKHIYKFNEQEAAYYFDWYMQKVPERIAYISKVCAKKMRVSEEKMDCSPESLLILWKWFRIKAKLEKAVHSEEEQNRKPNIYTNTQQLSLETEYILRDVGMYLGETFRKNNPNIYWSYYTKPSNDFFVNHPLLKGFVDRTSGNPSPVVFEPIHMARMQAVRLLNHESKDEDLLNLYNLWSAKK